MLAPLVVGLGRQVPAVLANSSQLGTCRLAGPAESQAGPILPMPISNSRPSPIVPRPSSLSAQASLLRTSIRRGLVYAPAPALIRAPLRVLSPLLGLPEPLDIPLHTLIGRSTCKVPVRQRGKHLFCPRPAWCPDLSRSCPCAITQVWGPITKSVLLRS